MVAPPPCDPPLPLSERRVGKRWFFEKNEFFKILDVFECSLQLLRMFQLLLPSPYSLLLFRLLLLATPDSLRPIPYSLFTTPYCLLPTPTPTPRSLLPTPYSLLPTAYCLLPTAYCLLPTRDSLLPTPYSYSRLPTPTTTPTKLLRVLLIIIMLLGLK